MEAEEILRRLRRIELRAKVVAETMLAGRYRSRFRGEGMEFEDVREYTYGDEVRRIHWQLTARMGRAYVKEFAEERELLVALLVDVSSSMDFGTSWRSLREAAAEVAGVLAHSASICGDRSSLVMVSDRVEGFVAPGRGRGHVYRVVREILRTGREQSRTRLSTGMEFLGRVLRRRGMVFVISDFLGVDDGFFRMVRRMRGRGCEVVGVMLRDERNFELPDVGMVWLRDPETGEEMLVNTSEESIRVRFAELARRHAEATVRGLREAGAGVMVVDASRDVLKPMLRFFSGA